MTSLSPLFDATSSPALSSEVGGLGDRGTWLLSGPQLSEGSEPIGDHLARLGVLPSLDRPNELRAIVRESGLQGRGGGRFPLARKIETALLAPGEPIMVVNASESEPASRKDLVLCRYRPHLVLDGAAATAAMVGASEVTVHLHRGSSYVQDALARAVAERNAAGLDDPEWRISVGPDRYVAGEASAIASFLNGGEARPHFSGIPMATRGPSGRPTLINNVETMAHLAFLLRFGASFWRSGGTPSSPGSQLLTLSGAVGAPGQVFELVGQASIGEVLLHAGLAAPPAAVLVGGYGGTWLEGEMAWQVPFDRMALECVGAQPGCGLIGVLPHGACGLVETARIVRYLAGESAGQCGPCVSGLPLMANACEDLGEAKLRRRGLRRLQSLGDLVLGSGACSHPDGVVRLVRSTLDVFEDDVVRHLAGHPCRAADHPPVFPVPVPDGLDQVWR
jgi:NADH:ubiquinone oxidoreductase subunit F (NADH-binding)